MSGFLTDPAGAFGNTAFNAGPIENCIAANTISVNELVALSTSAGYVIRNLVATAAGLQMGVALKSATAGQAVAVQIGGIATVNKGSAALTAGHACSADPTVSGAVGDVTAGFVITTAANLRGLVGTIVADASAAAATVKVLLGKV